jgi:hypothetical protein
MTEIIKISQEEKEKRSSCQRRTTGKTAGG